MDPTAPIPGERFDLVLVPYDVLEAVAAAQAEAAADTDGDPAADLPRCDDVPWPDVATIPGELVGSLPARFRLAQLDDDPTEAPWLVRSLVVADPAAPTGRRIVGHLGGHGRPDEHGTVEVGYSIAAAERRRGLASEAARTWYAWAARHGATRARLSTVAENAASRAIAAGLGLAEVGQVWDEDDQVWELVHEGPIPPSPR